MNAPAPPVTEELANALAIVLERDGPASCDALAAALGRRRAHVRWALEDDPRFVRKGRGPRTRWQLASVVEGDGNGTGYVTADGAGGSNGSDAGADAAEGVLRWSWDPPETSACTDPAGHRGANAHYRTPEAWAGLCIVCDGAITAPPLTFREWADGKGGEERRQTFENDYRDQIAGRATPEQVERMRFAFDEDDA